MKPKDPDRPPVSETHHLLMDALIRSNPAVSHNDAWHATLVDAVDGFCVTQTKPQQAVCVALNCGGWTMLEKGG